jgi:hypothetical protein
MSDLTRARANIRRAAREQRDPKRVRLNRSDFDLLMADYLRMGGWPMIVHILIGLGPLIGLGIGWVAFGGKRR